MRVDKDRGGEAVKPSRGKIVAARAFFRSLAEEPLACLLEYILSDTFELERGTQWFKLLLEADMAARREGFSDGADIILGAMLEGIKKAILVEDGEILRIAEDKYQTAMDIAGVWYDPYRPSCEEDAYRLTDKGAAMLGEYGVEGTAAIAAKKIEERRRKSP